MNTRKVVMILVDGLRPDAIENRLLYFTGQRQARTVMPSVTLPCHMSLFHSVTPDRHGILTNDYVPQVRPVKGLVECLSSEGKKCAMFYNWEQLRDLSRPGNLSYSMYISMKTPGTDNYLTNKALDYISIEDPDFLFLYLGETDEAGHSSGWMSEKYLQCANAACDCIDKVHSLLSQTHDIIVLADHGGHSRSHGTDSDEDMTIPILITSPHPLTLDTGRVYFITDVAPTVTHILGAKSDSDWEGKSILI